MPIKSITYKRIKNLGNYESKTLEATSIVNEGDDAARELEELIAFVEKSRSTQGCNRPKSSRNTIIYRHGRYKHSAILGNTFMCDRAQVHLTVAFKSAIAYSKKSIQKLEHEPYYHQFPPSVHL